MWPECWQRLKNFGGIGAVIAEVVGTQAIWLDDKRL
jgi:hypothetical protein